MSETKTRQHNVKTPGAVSPEPEAKNQRHEDDLPELPSELERDDDVTPSVTPTVTNAPDVQALIQAGIERGVAQALKAMKLAQSGPAPSHVDLPDQSTIDPSAIRKEVLTKQGYVVPNRFPGQADEQAKFPNAAQFRR